MKWLITNGVIAHVSPSYVEVVIMEEGNKLLHTNLKDGASCKAFLLDPNPSLQEAFEVAFEGLVNSRLLPYK